MSGHHSFGHGGFVTSRRDFLQRCGMGLGALAVPTLSGQSISPLAPRQSQTEGKAKAVIHLFMNGGPS
ncbi:twin-arginine translocation signal domain-containing protein, partial [Akkermansiaceae bacterium]|nr:twin-arginine translocation signal domain-containing protein [Akkermansiaceae bacterium]